MSTFQHSKPPAGQQTHDSDVPSNLLNFMLKSWKTGKPRVSTLKNHACFQERRKALSAKFPGELLIIPSGDQKVRNNDVFYPFRPSSDFFYLTGNQEPECILVLLPNQQGHQFLLFVDENPGKTDATFFTDRVKGELWEGPGVRLGVAESETRYRIPCQPLKEFENYLASHKPEAKACAILRDHSKRVDALVTAAERDKKLGEVLSEMRLIKDKEEIRALSEAIQATHLGFEDVIRRIKKAKTERELEGVFWTRARMDGNEVGYSSIVASGDHACTLHWKRNDGKLHAGDLLLLDAGVEGNSLYTADVTRTLPLNGKFSKEQKAIYDLVYLAQQAAMKEVKPGNDFMQPNRTAMRVLAEGLEELKLLPSAKEALDPKNQFYRRYTLHNVSHMLGLDVHDCAQARAETYKFGKLEPGMVLTVEPGLYFQPDDLTVPEKYRGIGVRIEDDVVVTEKGFKNLSVSLPSKSEEVEKWMKSLWRSK